MVSAVIADELEALIPESGKSSPFLRQENRKRIRSKAPTETSVTFGDSKLAHPRIEFAISVG